MKKTIVSLAILALVAVSAKAFADDTVVGTCSLGLTSVSGAGVNVSAIDPNAPITLNNDPTAAGPYNFSITDANPIGSGNIPNGSYSGFCVDLFHNIGNPSGQIPGYTVYAVDSTDGVTDLGLTGQTLKNVFALLTDYKAANGGSVLPSAGVNGDALTIALWAALNGYTSIASGASPNNMNPVPGVLTVSWAADSSTTGMALAEAQTWINTLSTTTPDTGDDFYAFYNPAAQGQEIMLASVPNSVTTTPEPGSLVGLAGMGLVGCVSCIRRRRLA